MCPHTYQKAPGGLELLNDLVDVLNGAPLRHPADVHVLLDVDPVHPQAGQQHVKVLLLTVTQKVKHIDFNMYRLSLKEQTRSKVTPSAKEFHLRAIDEDVIIQGKILVQ